jgi:hypothetical protein
VIRQDEMMAPLLVACPSSRPSWEAFVAEWRDDEEGLPL